jgi:heme/copper-type cytochrome/quinol oxidase subunit 2
VIKMDKSIIGGLVIIAILFTLMVAFGSWASSNPRTRDAYEYNTGLELLPFLVPIGIIVLWMFWRALTSPENKDTDRKDPFKEVFDYLKVPYESEGKHKDNE